VTFTDTEPAPGRAAWLRQLADLAQLYGWRVYDFGEEYEPDLLLLRRPRLIWVFAEPLRGRLSQARLDAFVELRACRQEAGVWRPDDLEKIERILE